jgi:hypothetical protein
MDRLGSDDVVRDVTIETVLCVVRAEPIWEAVETVQGDFRQSVVGWRSEQQQASSKSWEVDLWRLSVWFEDFMCGIVQWYQESVCSIG